MLIRAGFTDRRNGAPSLRRLGEAAGVNVSTVSRLVIQNRGLTDVNMQKIAEALRVPVEDLYLMSSGVGAAPFVPPKGTEKLSVQEKDALAEIIRALVNAKEQGNEHADQKSVAPSERDQEKTQGHYDLVARKRIINTRGTDKNGHR